jgi:hypothetical protein
MPLKLSAKRLLRSLSLFLLLSLLSLVIAAVAALLPLVSATIAALGWLSRNYNSKVGGLVA